MADEKDDGVSAALAQFEVNIETNGVAAIKVSDGEIFGFTRQTLLCLINKMDDAKSDRITVFVKTGPTLQPN